MVRRGGRQVALQKLLQQAVEAMDPAAAHHAAVAYLEAGGNIHAFAYHRACEQTMCMLRAASCLNNIKTLTFLLEMGASVDNCHSDTPGTALS
jgi:hypothetical protein